MSCKKCGGTLERPGHCRRCGPQSGPRLAELSDEAALVLEMARAQCHRLSWAWEVRRRLFSWVRQHGLSA
jgi:hypothetical protein